MHRSNLFIVVLLASAVAASAQDWAKAKIEKSPRHGEWVKIDQGPRKIESFITYPEVKEKATAVVVIHEIFGLTDWVRNVTDELAEAGYIAISPDLLSGAGPKGGGTSELGDGVGKAISSLPPDQITADLDAVVEYVSKLPSCNGKVVVMGFCWGGGQSFRFATNNKKIKGVLSFYGPPPTKDEDLGRINSPVWGFYGGNDNRINSMVPKATEQMKKAVKTYEPVTYEGAGHGFMRAGETPEPKDGNARAQDAYKANKKARDDAWKRVQEILKTI